MGPARSGHGNSNVWPEVALFGGAVTLAVCLGLLIATNSIAVLIPILAAGLSVLIGATAVIVQFVPAPARYLLFVGVLAVSAGVFFFNLDDLQGLVGLLVLVAVAALVSRTRASIASLVILVGALAVLVLVID